MSATHMLIISCQHGNDYAAILLPTGVTALQQFMFDLAGTAHVVPIDDYNGLAYDATCGCNK